MEEVDDSRGLEAASSFARQKGLPLVVLFVLSPGDFKMHDISTRRIDFVLRNLRILQVSNRPFGKSS
jgi:deoxyribodipyrimidine photo-lyase